MGWFFNGLGTALIGLLIGAISGGAVGYRIGIKKSNQQNQKSGDNSTQIQIGDGNYNGR
jgi:Na+/glutamate symporter